MENFWSDKKVLLTGHTGFKGAWLCEILQSFSCDVIGYSLPPVENSLYGLLGLEKRVKNYFYDIRDLSSIKKTVSIEKPDIIIHMAAQPLVLESYADPCYTFETNVIGSMNVLEAARENSNLIALLNITTDKVYRNNEWVWGYRESDSLGGNDPYSASKACSEILTESYRHSFFSNSSYVMTARSGNVIGGGDWSKNRIVPDIVRAYQSGKFLEVRNPGSVRPWQHVIDPLMGYLKLIEKTVQSRDVNNYSGAWNFGPANSETHTVKELIRCFNKHLDSVVRMKDDGQTHGHESSLLMLDISKSVNQLGWRPVLSFDDTVKFTAEWYKRYLKGDDAHFIVSRQIAEYCERIQVSV